MIELEGELDKQCTRCIDTRCTNLDDKRMKFDTKTYNVHFVPTFIEQCDVLELDEKKHKKAKEGAV
jgi:hypothetical protein